VSKKKTEEVPRVKKPAAFFILLFGNILVGLILSSIVGLISWQIVKNMTISASGLIGTVGAILTSYPVGNILGILVLKKWLHLEGSLIWSILACFLGTVTVLGFAELFNISALITLITLSITAPLAATTGFILSKGKSKHKVK
jgi:tetrahydromethanopterin S-methyltransferase subunit E